MVGPYEEGWGVGVDVPVSSSGKGVRGGSFNSAQWGKRVVQGRENRGMEKGAGRREKQREEESCRAVGGREREGRERRRERGRLLACICVCTRRRPCHSCPEACITMHTQAAACSTSFQTDLTAIICSVCRVGVYTTYLNNITNPPPPTPQGFTLSPGTDLPGNDYACAGSQDPNPTQYCRDYGSLQVRDDRL